MINCMSFDYGNWAILSTRLTFRTFFSASFIHAGFINISAVAKLLHQHVKTVMSSMYSYSFIMAFGPLWGHILVKMPIPFSSALTSCSTIRTDSNFVRNKFTIFVFILIR